MAGWREYKLFCSVIITTITAFYNKRVTLYWQIFKLTQYLTIILEIWVMFNANSSCSLVHVVCTTLQSTKVCLNFTIDIDLNGLIVWSVSQHVKLTSLLPQSNAVVFLNLSSVFRWEAIWVQTVPPAIQGLLRHDQAPAHPQRCLALPMHHLPGVLPQPVSHAEAHERPQARGHPPGLAHREDLPVPLLRLRTEKGFPVQLSGRQNVSEEI